MSMKDRVREVRDKYRALKNTWPSISCLTVEADLDALLTSPEEPGELTGNAEQRRADFVAGVISTTEDGYQLTRKEAEAEALRRYPDQHGETPDSGEHGSRILLKMAEEWPATPSAPKRCTSCLTEVFPGGLFTISSFGEKTVHDGRLYHWSPSGHTCGPVVEDNRP